MIIPDADPQLLTIPRLGGQTPYERLKQRTQTRM
jgi:hypothetical protein